MRKKTYKEDELDEQLAAEEREDLSFVWDAVKSLPDTQREVIHLFYQEGYQTSEIAEILGRKDATIRSDLKRARENLKKLPKKAKAAFKKSGKTYNDITLKPVALLGTQAVAGTNYRYLCVGSGENGPDLYLTEVYQDLKGKATITSCKVMDLEKYLQ